ncbi:MAG: DNA cytosine methyltransferase [Rhabdochlamydiaceae bacterium]
MKLCIDLCSGLEGLSSAFKKSLDYEVITVDMVESFNPTIVADVRDLTRREIEEASHFKSLDKYSEIGMIMSPPCTYFSRAAGVGFCRTGTAKSLTIVAGCVRLIEEIRPRWFVLENPDNGYLRFFLGKPNVKVKLDAFGYKTVKPTALWTNLPIGLIPESPNRNKTKNAWANWQSPRPEIRAKMPEGLSQLILESSQSIKVKSE